MSVKTILKYIVPEKVFEAYHYQKSVRAAKKYKFPGKKMMMIGITGTKGKTTTANFIWSVLSAGGLKCGLIGTANIRIGDKERLNEYHMTMPSPNIIQKLLSDMVEQGCKYCVMEVTSEGIKQWRHYGIDFDIAIFTNLTPEHLPSHSGSFEKYKEAKGKLFQCLKCCNKNKRIDGKDIQKTIIANSDGEHADYYLGFDADRKIKYGINSKADVLATDIVDTVEGVDFSVAEIKYHLNILGKFNVYNALPVFAVCDVLELPKNIIQKGLSELKMIPGRMEKIDEGQNFTVIVDYAHEKESMTALLTTSKNIAKSSNGKIIILLGAEGGGRDKAKRALMGELAGKLADYVICANVDPYEDDPYPIANDIAISAEKTGKVREKDLFVILDRREGIRKALGLATKNDLVLITGKGAEQSMIIGGKSIVWDDRKVTREELTKLKNT